MCFLLRVSVAALAASFVASAAAAAPCEPTAIAVVSGYLEARDRGHYARAQRYLSAGFAPQFHEQRGIAYLEYMGAGRQWHGSEIAAAAVSAGQCVVQVTATRESDVGTTTVAEAYTLALTPRGWRIDRWEWQPVD